MGNTWFRSFGVCLHTGTSHDVTKRPRWNTLSYDRSYKRSINAEICFCTVTVNEKISGVLRYPTIGFVKSNCDYYLLLPSGTLDVKAKGAGLPQDW